MACIEGLWDSKPPLTISVGGSSAACAAPGLYRRRTRILVDVPWMTSSIWALPTSVPGCRTASALVSQQAVTSSTFSGKLMSVSGLLIGQRSMLGTDKCRRAAVRRHVHRIADLHQPGNLGPLQRHSLAPS